MDAAPDGAVRWTDGVVWLENWITVGRDSSTGAEGNFSRTARKDMSTAFHLTRHISPDAFSQFSQVAKSIIHVSQPVNVHQRPASHATGKMRHPVLSMLIPSPSPSPTSFRASSVKSYVTLCHPKTERYAN